MEPPSLRPASVPAILVLLSAAATSPCRAQTAGTEHTLRAEPGATPPRASISDVSWLSGRWTGRGLEATVEESWLPPVDGAMAGVFRLTREGELRFYELVTLAEEGRSLVLRLKHFGPDLVGWEEMAESVSFPLVRRRADTWWFDGLTIRRVGEDRMRIWVALETDEGEAREALFEYRRAGGRGE